MQETLPKIIVDTDAGHDDALALMLLIGSRQFDIQAVTTVAGNSTIENVTRNARAILDLLGDTATPLYSGAAKPLARELVQAVVHGDSGLDGLDMSGTAYSMTGDAPARINELARAHPGEITLLALGPLTNIARSLEADPELGTLLKEIIIMGGAIDVPGNKSRVAEFNMFVDPEAANAVCKAPVKKVLVPLDPCNDIVLQLDTFEPLAGTPLYEPLCSMMRHFIAGITADEGVQGALVYDALAAYYLVNPAAFTLQAMDVAIETKGEYTDGMTVAEKRPYAHNKPNMEVVTAIDQDAFVRDLLAALRLP